MRSSAGLEVDNMSTACETFEPIFKAIAPRLLHSSRGQAAGCEGMRPDIIAAMALQDLSDEDLVARYREIAQSQERELCVNELFRRNYARVARWCLRFTSNRESAADLAQEVFTRAYQSLDSFQGQSKFSSWLFTIARNHCLNVIRVNSRQATELKTGCHPHFFGEIPDSREGPDAGLDRAATAEQVAQVLNSALDDTEKIIFTLHYGDEVPLDSITRMLGLENASGAKAYIVSAKRKLARWISQKKVQRP